MSLPWTVERTHPTVVTLRMEGIAKGWSQDVLLRSDAHHDNLHSDHVLEKKHLDEAQRLGAPILDYGDLFCAMQGKWDKRADPRQIPAEIREMGRPYMDALVAYNAEFYEPYALNWALMSPGNHETGFAKRHETNLTERLAERLKMQESPVQVGSYQGWVRFMFRWNGTKQKSLRLWYHHGYGGGGAVTKGVPQNHRQMANLGNADFIVNGHTHTQYWVTDMQESLDVNGKPALTNVECLRCPGYKDEYSCGNGWAVERGHSPKPKGAWWLRFFLENDQIEYEIRQAK